VAHDNRKKDLIEWLEYNWRLIIPHKLYCTGTTGRLVEEAILKKISMNYASDNYTDDDLMEPQPHDVDVKALARIAVLYNIPIANNRSTADFLISSPLFQSNYKPVIKNYAEYIHRKL